MRMRRPALPLASLAFLFSLFFAPLARPLPCSRAQSAASGPVIYLSDFELPAAPPRPSRTANPRQQATEEPSEQAKLIITSLKSNLTETLKKAGFSVQNFPASGRQPDHGVLVRGVFTEPDEYNRVRRVILGSGSPSPKLVLYVGLTNLARPDQPLYEFVPPNAPGFPVEVRFGPLITINAYLPVASFELTRRPSEGDLKKTASDITRHLASLIAANPALKP